MARGRSACVMAVATVAVAVGTGGPDARANITFVNTYDSTVTSRSDYAQIQTAMNAAEAEFSNVFSDNITLNFTIQAGGGLGGSSTPISSFSYSQIVTALTSHATSASDLAWISHLPAINPAPGNTYVLTNGEAKVLGLRTANNTASDGTFTFGAGNSYTLDPNNRAVSGKYDFIGVAEHELSEMMGRIYGLGENGYYLPLDLTRYTAPSTRNFTDAANVYFSIDDGVTNLKYYNFANGNGSDPQDWASGVNDSFNAFGGTGALEAFTPVDHAAMDILGYTPIAGNNNYTAGSGKWLNPNNWSLSRSTTTGDVVSLTASAGAPVTVTLDGSSAPLAQLTIDGTGANAVTLLMNANVTLATTGTVFVGLNATGNLTQSTGTNTVGGTLFVAYNPSSHGTYAISGGTATLGGLTVADDNGAVGSVAQTGGVVTVNGPVSIADFSGGSSGSYTLASPGTLAVTGSTTVGTTGRGSFAQTGGSSSFGGTLTICGTSGTAGTFSYLGGTVVAGNVAVNANGLLTLADAGPGGFRYVSLAQNAGTVVATGAEYIGVGATSTYTQGAGSHTAGSLYVGYTGNGTYAQSGGTTAASGVVALAYLPSSRGTYTMSGGRLAAALLLVGDDAGAVGSFSQTGGQVALTGSAGLDLADYIATSVGSYALSGTGTLTVTGASSVGTVGSGTFAQSGGSSAFNGGLVVPHAGGASGNVALSGGSMLASTIAVQPNGTFQFTGGTLRATSGITQTGGVFNAAAGIAVDGSAVNGYALSGGTFVATGQFIPIINGTFSQTGGANVGIDLLDAGYFGTGTYAFSAGVLSANFEDVGVFGNAAGTLSQTGGTNTVQAVRVGAFGDATTLGVVNLSGGTLSCTPGGVELGGNGSAAGVGILNVSGGSLDAGASPIQVYNTSAGANVSSVKITGGAVSAGNLVVPDWSRLTFTGGTLKLGAGTSGAGGTLVVGDAGGTATLSQTAAGGLVSATTLELGLGSGSTGTYSLNVAARLSSGDEYVGYNGTGTFNQSAGTNAATGFVYIAYNPNSRGNYALSGGSFSTGGLIVSDDAGAIGTFSQTGGTVTVGSPGLALAGFSPASNGTYALSAGTLTVAGPAYVGALGTGQFTQTGGSSTFNGGVVVGPNASNGAVTLAAGSMSTGTMTIDANANAYVQGGTLSAITLDNEGGHFFELGGTVSLTSSLTVNGGQVQLGGTQSRFAIPSVSALAGTLFITQNGGHLLDVGTSLSIAGTGHVDLGDNDLVVRGGNLAAITGHLSNAYHGQAGITSYLENDIGGSYTSLGVLLDSDGRGGALYATFDGVAVAKTDVLVKYTYVGDTDLSGSVDSADLANLLAGMNGHLTGWVNGDLNYDGVVNGTDLAMLMGGLTHQGAPLGGGAGNGGAVPEPSMTVACIGAAGMLGHRRRRSN